MPGTIVKESLQELRNLLRSSEAGSDHWRQGSFATLHQKLLDRQTMSATVTSKVFSLPTDVVRE